MLPCLLVALFLFVRVHSSISNFENFNPLNPLSHIENSITPHESSNRKSLQSNRVMECDMEDVFNIVGISELQELVEVLAAKKGTTPFAIMRMLQKRMKNKEDMEGTIFNSMDRVSIPDLLSPPLVDIPPPMRIPPISNAAIYTVPSNDHLKNIHEKNTDVVIIPVASAPNGHPNRLPPVMKADFLSRNEASDIYGNVGATFGRINQVLPGMFPLPPVKNNQLRPPFGATVRVDSIDPLNPINRDIIITVSPLMTVVEALRQAEIKYQNILGLNHETAVITFIHSPVMDCYMVNQINGMTNNEEYAWKVTITDRDSQVVYNNFCLPNGREAFVKPGTLISLSYVPL